MRVQHVLRLWPKRGTGRYILVYGLRKATKNRRTGYDSIWHLPNAIPGVYLETHVLSDSEREPVSAGVHDMKKAQVCWAPIRGTPLSLDKFLPEAPALLLELQKWYLCD
jgi:hypothetical protein